MSTATDQQSTDATIEQPRDDEAPTRDELFHVLRNRRRRFAIHHLKRVNEPVDVGDLATQVAAWENDVPVDAVTSKQRRRVYNALQQTHVPELDDTGLAETDRRDVELTERAAELDVYLERVMPVLDGAVTFGYEADTQAPLRIAVDRRLVVRNAEPTDGQQESPTVYWEQTRNLGSSARTLQPDGSHRTTFQVNVTEAYREARAESERLGAPGQNEVAVAVEVTASRGDGPNRTRTFVMPIVHDGQTYRVQGEPGTVSFDRTETASVQVRPGPVRAYGAPTVAVLGLVGAGVLVGARRRDALALTEDERELLAYRDHREEYADWITTGRLPAAVFDRPRAEVDSLAGLVDVAIDTDERVINDVDRGTYHVVVDDLLYAYDPPEAVHEGGDGADVPAGAESPGVAGATDGTAEFGADDDVGTDTDGILDDDAVDDAFDEATVFGAASDDAADADDTDDAPSPGPSERPAGDDED